MDRLQELSVLVAVIDHGSLTAAARRLRRSPPAVTRALAALENRVGVRLVERSTRRLSPTQTGRVLAERARALLHEYESANGRHHLIVTGFDLAKIRSCLTGYARTCSAKTWHEAAMKLSRLGHWEFEDYRL
jgi:DNA-binding transcriptional LysR family regulator